MPTPYCFHPQVAPWLKPGLRTLGLTLFSHRQTPLQAAWVQTQDERLLPLIRTGQHGELILWRAELPLVAEQEGYSYGFKLLVDGHDWWLHAGGLTEIQPAPERYFHSHCHHRPPQWVQDQIVYQIVPDRFCDGDLAGIQSKLYYLQSLGITALYLNSLFAPPSHQPDDSLTAYRVDPQLGGKAQLAELTATLHQRGMRLILDASLAPGALATPDLAAPKVQEAVYRGENALLRHWLRPPHGIDGWRLDLRQWPDEATRPGLMHELRQSVKQESPDAYLLDERLSEASAGLQGDQADGAMNYHGFAYPVRAFLAGQDASGRPLHLSAEAFHQWLQQARTALPLANQLSQLNLLDSHDTPRFFSLLEGDLALMRTAVTLLFTYIGVPCVFYGDEIGLQDGAGHRSFPWDSTEWQHLLHDHYRRLIRLRKTHPALRRGDIHTLYAGEHSFVFARTLESDVVITALNRHPQKARTISLPIWQTGSLASRFTDPENRDKFEVVKGEIQLTIPARTARVLLAS